MASLTIHKTVSALPETLENNSIYYVRVGSGFDIYITNAIGGVTAYPLNSSGGGLGVGELPVRYDAVQPETDCLWIAPNGAVVLITGS